MPRKYNIFTAVVFLYLLTWISTKYAGLASELLFFDLELGVVIFLLGLSILLDWGYTSYNKSKLILKYEHIIYLILAFISITLYFNSGLFNTGYDLLWILPSVGIMGVGIGATVVGIYELTRFLLTAKTSDTHTDGRKYGVFLSSIIFYLILIGFLFLITNGAGGTTNFIKFFDSIGILKTAPSPISIPVGSASKSGQAIISLTSIDWAHIFLFFAVFGLAQIFNWIFMLFRGVDKKKLGLMFAAVFSIVILYLSYGGELLSIVLDFVDFRDADSHKTDFMVYHKIYFVFLIFGFIGLAKVLYNLLASFTKWFMVK